MFLLLQHLTNLNSSKCWLHSLLYFRTKQPENMSHLYFIVFKGDLSRWTILRNVGNMFWWVFGFTPSPSLLASSSRSSMLPQASLDLSSLGAWFGLELEDKLKEATLCDEVKIALGNKVSHERIGYEVNIHICRNQVEG